MACRTRYSLAGCTRACTTVLAWEAIFIGVEAPHHRVTAITGTVDPIVAVDLVITLTDALGVADVLLGADVSIIARLAYA